VSPDRVLAEVRPPDVELLILPGGDMWEGGYPRSTLEHLLRALIATNVPVAAICGATLAVARSGLLNDRRHTSNMPSYLRDHAPEYTGSALYEDSLAVHDRGVITASGLGPVDFARVIFGKLAVFSASDEQLWYDMFKHGQLPADAG
jgi:putative intracellular protease/amidase